MGTPRTKTGASAMGKLCKIIIFCLCVPACCGVQDPAPTQRNATPPCVWCPKKTTTHRTTTHSTLHTTHSSTIHSTATHTTANTNHTTTPHPTTQSNHTTTPHTTTPHTTHTTTPHTTAHTTHTTTPHTTTHTTHTTAHTTHTTTPHTTTPHTTTTHTTTPHTTAHTTHTTAHTTHTSTPHRTTQSNHTSTPHTTAPHTTHTTTPHTTAPHTTHTTTPHTTTPHTTTPHPTTHSNHTTAHANYTTPHLTTATSATTVPPSTEYIVNGTTGVCLRITASFNISYSDTMKREIVIPPAPSTQASGNCSAEKAWLTLTFPRGEVTMTFRQDTEGNNFFLGEVNITLKNTGPEKFANMSLKDMVTPLGRSFSCEKVDIQVTSKVFFSVMNVRAQAFKLEGGTYGREMKCSHGPPSMTVPIVVGVILVALVLIVVIAYIVARQRSQRGYQPL